MGTLNLITQSTTDPDPRPGPLEITTADFPFEELQARCGGGLSRNGCILCDASTYPLLSSCRLYQNPEANARPGTIHVHELGHAIGLCHLAGERLPNAVMASPNRSTSNSFTEAELQAIQLVFANPALEAGSTRADFVSAGLLSPL